MRGRAGRRRDAGSGAAVRGGRTATTPGGGAMRAQPRQHGAGALAPRSRRPARPGSARRMASRNWAPYHALHGSPISMT